MRIFRTARARPCWRRPQPPRRWHRSYPPEDPETWKLIDRELARLR
ncbi:hypothetical protein [Couchioplanes azureus]|nr:hypothetical protein [Couchioplanes caeruleus]